MAPLDTLSILDWDRSITQQDLITERDFVKAAAQRGLDLSLEQLEALHRLGIVIPVFSIRYVATEVIRRLRRAQAPRDASRIQTILWAVNTGRQSLIGERDVGDLGDPTTEGFKPWSASGTYLSGPYPRRRFLYSSYQLLSLREILRMCPGGDPQRLDELRGNSRARRTHLGLLRRMGEHQRSLALLLTLLETAYLPEIRPRLRGFDIDMESWASYRESFSVPEAVEATGFERDSLGKEAERLLRTSHGFDPLAKWWDLVGLVHYKRWDELTGLPRLALEYRIAAEMLLSAQRDFPNPGQPTEADPGQSSQLWQALDYRLTVPRDRLNRTLARFDLSPHPRVLLVLEGKIEHRAFTGYFAERLRPGWRNRIQVIDVEGVRNDLSPVATLVAPLAGPRDGDVTILERSPTRILIVADPEGSLGGAQGRGTLLQRWITRLLESLPDDMQTPIARADLEGFVEFETWDGENSFEFAHFSDQDLAHAIAAVSRSRSTQAIPELLASVRTARANHRNLESVWSTWDRPHPTKMTLFRHLESTFRARVHDSFESSADPPDYPAARIVVRTLRLAQSWPVGSQIVLRVTEPTTNQRSP